MKISEAMTAEKLLKIYGKEAIDYAEAQFEHCQQIDDVKGAAIWLGILNDLEKKTQSSKDK